MATKAVLVRKRRRTFGMHNPKAPLCRKEGASAPQMQAFAELAPKVTEGLFFGMILLLTIPLSCFASHLPLHKGGSLPPDHSPERCNTLYLASKMCKKGQRNFTFSVLFRRGELRARGRSQNAPTKMIFYR